jgi:hypothetical protein
MANGDYTVNTASLSNDYAFGTYTGETSVANNILCGFQPRKIVLYNVTDHSMLIWVHGMDAGSYRLIVAAGTQTDPATGGPVVYEGSADTYTEGFTIPAALATFNTNADEIVWEAWR